MGDDRWAIKRPRGTNPAIERGDLEAIAAVAAAVASAGRPGTAAGRKSRQSRFRYGPDRTQTSTASVSRPGQNMSCALRPIMRISCRLARLGCSKEVGIAHCQKATSQSVVLLLLEESKELTLGAQLW